MRSKKWVHWLGLCCKSPLQQGWVGRLQPLLNQILNWFNFCRNSNLELNCFGHRSIRTTAPRLGWALTAFAEVPLPEWQLEVRNVKNWKTEMSRVVWHPFLIYIDLWSMGEWFPGPSSSWEKTLTYLLQSKKVDQREHCMKAKYKIHKYKKSQRGHCSKAGGHLVCWRPPKSHAASSRKFDLSWGSDILTLGHWRLAHLAQPAGRWCILCVSGSRYWIAFTHGSADIP